MNSIVNIGRKAVDLKFKVLGLKIIQDIPTDDFNRILRVLINMGWVRTFEYKDFDAWIDYGKVILSYEDKKLVFKWDNWSEGEISGKARDIDVLAAKFVLTASETPKWWPTN